MQPFRLSLPVNRNGHLLFWTLFRFPLRKPERAFYHLPHVLLKTQQALQLVHLAFVKASWQTPTNLDNYRHQKSPQSLYMLHSGHNHLHSSFVILQAPPHFLHFRFVEPSGLIVQITLVGLFFPHSGQCVITSLFLRQDFKVGNSFLQFLQYQFSSM